MAIELREVQSPKDMKSDWQHLVVALQPISENMPRSDDREHFRGLPSFLIGKEPRISNIPKHLMFIYIRKARFVNKALYYSGILNRNFIRRELINYLSELAQSLGEEGLFIKYGIGGYQQQFMRQEIVQPRTEEKKKSWFG